MKVHILCLAIVVSTILLGTTHVLASTGPNIVLLSQRYNDEQFSDQIVGEVSNNGTSPAEFVEATVSFYDGSGQIVGTESGYADPTTLQPGSRAPFTVLITSDAIENQAQTYDITLQWRDSDFNEFSERVLSGQPLSSGGETGQPEPQEEQPSEDNGSRDGGSQDNGSGDGGSGSEEETL